MTTGGQSFSAIDAILKDIYDGPINEQLPNEVLMYNLLSGREGGVESNKPIDKRGRRIIVPIHVRRNKGIGVTPENATMPVAGRQQFADEVITLTNLYGAIRLTGQVMEFVNGNNEGSFLAALKEEIEGMAETFPKDFNRQCYGDGTGTLATVSAAAAQNATTISVNPTMWLEEGDYVDIVNPANGTVVAGGNSVVNVSYAQQGAAGMVYITGVTFANGVSAAVPAGSVLVRNNGNAGQNNWNGEILGLATAIGTGSYLNVSPATYSTWQSTIMNNGGASQAWSETLMQAAQKNAKRRSGVTPKTCVTTDGVQAQAAKVLSAQKRFNDTKLRGGFSTLDYNGTEIISDTDCPLGTMYLLNIGDFTFYHTRPPHWAETGGSVMHWDPNNSDAAIGYYRYFVQLAAKRRNTHTLVTNISE